MNALKELTVREAAKRARRSEETIRRWIWTGRLHAVKRGTSYRIDVVHLEEVIAGLESAGSVHGTEPSISWREWREEVREWKAGLPTKPGVTASDLVIEDRRARR